MQRIAAGFGLAVLLTLAASCSDDKSYEERRDYLNKIALRGAETHDLLVAQKAPAIDIRRCSEAYDGLADQRADRPNMPGDLDDEWVEQIKAFFVDSCVSGTPRHAGNEPPPPSTQPSPAAVPTSATSAPPSLSTVPSPSS